ncbi:uncharacterized protein LOC142988275 isoform X1 [Genypterus blacodes]|uniref:uncharacterized protein LOC142988275 isoform X1 n=1 Tax=Genypterus blacodes TaxID=154954 RepID=UPI003F7780BA
MHNWQENEIRELLSLRGSEQFRNQITGTVKDSVVYQRMAQLLAERGVQRSHMQVISKLKSLRKKYLKHQQHPESLGPGPDWPFYDQCHQVFGKAAGGSPGKRSRSPTPPPPPPTACIVKEEEDTDVVVGLWDEGDDEEIDKHLGPVEEEDELQDDSEHLRPITHAAPRKKKKKTTVMDQVTTLVSATVSQLREMDAAMQAQEEERLQRLMEHEREMQSGLLRQLEAMTERRDQDHQQRQLELLDRLLAKFPGPSGR